MRTAAKTTTFAITHFTVALTVGWAITGSFVLGSLLAVIEPAVNTVAYIFHEMIWNHQNDTLVPSTVMANGDINIEVQA